MKKVLIYPCGTEIALEIYRSLRFSAHYIIYGGADSYGHGRFVFKNYVDGLPFITDSSSEKDVAEFNEAVSAYEFDFIYPAMDGVVTVFSKYREYLTPVVVAPPYSTAQITRSKKKTYQVLEGTVPVPEVFHSKNEIKGYPVFVKPDVGQGSVGARSIYSGEELDTAGWESMLCMEMLPGNEYTVDCLTNSDGKLVFAKGRRRKRIKDGISVNAEFIDNPLFWEYAERINGKLRQKGGWFFQLREAKDGALKLLEAASRIAGTSAITRCIGVNLPLLTVDIFNGRRIEEVIVNPYRIELDRALANSYRLGLEYSTVYIDYDDTIVGRGMINTLVVRFLYQCVNRKKRIVLISKHDGDLIEELERYRLESLFDEIHHISREEEKKDYIVERDAVFIDDSYGERKKVHDKTGIPVFDTHMVECLLEG